MDNQYIIEKLAKGNVIRKAMNAVVGGARKTTKATRGLTNRQVAGIGAAGTTLAGGGYYAGKRGKEKNASTVDKIAYMISNR